MLWQWILNPQMSPLYYISKQAGINLPLFLNDQTLALWSIVVINALRSLGFTLVMLMAGFSAIPESVEEAASIDGCGKLRNIWYIILPLVKPVTLVMIIVMTISNFNIVTLILTLTGGGPVYATETMPIRLYTEAFTFFKNRHIFRNDDPDADHQPRLCGYIQKGYQRRWILLLTPTAVKRSKRWKTQKQHIPIMHFYAERKEYASQKSRFRRLQAYYAYYLHSDYSHTFFMGTQPPRYGPQIRLYNIRRNCCPSAGPIENYVKVVDADRYAEMTDSPAKVVRTTLLSGLF